MGTEITDSMAMGMVALSAMETNAARLSETAARLLMEHADRLPNLLGIRAESTETKAQLTLQARTVEDGELWARSLGVDLVVTTEAANEGAGTVVQRSAAEFDVEGVRVRLASCEWLTAAQQAERAAVAVAA